jgi:HD-GYP domain-containing protein (c-di-GMP phosphodiesterase class II)
VPSEILSKPGKLSPAEMNLIKTHPQAGFDILSEIQFPWPVAEIVLQHHERMDGSGYPKGLKGEEILLEARIICVADVVEAIASHRPYRPALTLEEAIKDISENSGILYDKKVVEACIKVIREEKYVFEESNSFFSKELGNNSN